MLILSLLSVLLLKSVAPSLAAAQLIFFIIGFGVFWLVSRFPYEFLERWRWVVYGLLIFL
jgi:cell division protein FtsW (lipid II flippase)